MRQQRNTYLLYRIDCASPLVRKIFFSFAWEYIWRVNQVRNSWVTKGNYQNTGFSDKAKNRKTKITNRRAYRIYLNVFTAFGALGIPIPAKSRQPRSQTIRILPQTTGLD